MEPTYSFRHVSLVTDRNSLRKLLTFLSDRSSENWDIEVELVHNTLFLTRWEKNYNLLFSGSFNSGFGHSFESEFLGYENGMEESCSHHRMVEYEIGGMKWVVRFEADGYSVDTHQDNEAKIATSMDNLCLEDATPMMLEGVSVVRKGYLVPPSSIIEVKCRSGNRTVGRNDTLQCYISQTKHLFVGGHKDGVVHQVNKTDLSSNLEAWERGHEAELGKLLTLVEKLGKIAKGFDSRKYRLTYNRSETPKALMILKSHEKGLSLSAEAIERCWRQ